MKHIITFIVGLLFTTNVLFSATIIVTSGDDSGTGTLRQAVIDAKSGDEIVFASNVTSISLLALVIDKNLTITGDAINTTVLQRNTTVTNINWHIEIDSAATVTLNNLTFQDFYSCVGGAVYSNGNLTMNNCKILNNRAKTSASGIYSAGELNVYNTVFKNNQNGAVCCGKANIEGCTFNGNYCQNGGAITVSGGKTVSIKNCLFEGNSASTFGGAITNRGYATIDNCIFRNNSAVYSESVIGNAGEILINNCLFDGNQKNVFGNSSFIESINVKATIVNSLFIRNVENFSTSGVIENGRYATLNVINCTIADNTAIGLYANNYEGYGTKNFDNIYLYNNVFYNNAISNGEKYDIYVNYNSNNPEQTILATAYNNIIGKTNLILNNSNFIGQDPLFVSNGDYSLQESSPAIDAGTNSYYPYNEFPKDLANNYRIDNTTIDLGAYEYQTGNPYITDISLNINKKLNIYNQNRTIIVDNCVETVSIFDIMGHLIASGIRNEFSVPQSGVYMVKVGEVVTKVIVE